MCDFARALADSKRYFASVEPEELAASICARLEDVAKDLKWDDRDETYRHLYGHPLGLQREGDVEQLVRLHVPKSKALLQALVGLMLGSPKTLRAEARNADVEPRGAVLLGSNLLEFLWKSDGLDLFCTEWATAAVAFRESYALPYWDNTKGAAIGLDPRTGAVFAGGARVCLVQAWDVFFDTEYRSWEDVPWVVVRTYVNRADLAAVEPDENKRAQIEAFDGSTFLATTLRKLASSSTTHDVVPKYTLFHRPSPAVPSGLKVEFLSKDIMLSAEELEEIPLVRMVPSRRIDSPFGDSLWEGTIQIEQATDGVESAIATNFDAHGTQAVAMDSTVTPTRDKTNNLAIFEVPPGKDVRSAVVPLQLTKQPEGAGEWLTQKQADMAFITGQNDVQLGQAPSAQMNAKAFAILEGAAQKANSSPQKEVLTAIGKLGGKLLRLMAANMTEEQALSLGGRAARLNYPIKKFTGKDLAPITTCVIEVGNPLEQTPAGRLELFTMYQSTGAVKTPEDVVQIVETGRLEQALQPQREESLLISYENDEILEGRTPVVHWAHNAVNHCSKHVCLASQPTALASPPAMQALQQHLDWHYREFWGLPEGTPPKSDPMYFDRMRVLLGQPAPGAIGPPPMGGEQPSPADGPPPPSGPPSNSSGPAPSALQPPNPPPAPEEGEQPDVSTVLQ